MASLDAVSLTILLGAVMVLAGIMSSLVALRFGAPLLLVFLVIGMLAGQGGPGGIRFDDLRSAYLIGSIALALILFDGGLRTRTSTIRSALVPAGLLATIGVLLTAAFTAPIAKAALGIGWLEAFLVGAVVGATDVAAVFLLIHTRGLRLRPRVGAVLEVESATNDPFAIFLAIVLIQILNFGDQPWSAIALTLAEQGLLGAVVGILGGHAMALVLNRLELPQGLHAPFVATAALVVFALAAAVHGSGFLAAYLAGIVVGNRRTRAHQTVIVFLDAVTWLAQIVMFMLLGLLVSPVRLAASAGPALLVAAALMLVARPAAVMICLAPFRFSWREKLFISWVGLRGAVGIFLGSIPLLIGMRNAQIYFDVAFVSVLTSLLIQGWTIASAARWLHVALPRIDPAAHRVELDLPGQLTQELVGYAVETNSPYLRRGIIPSWAKPTLVVRDEQVLTAAEAGSIHPGDYLYVLAPPERAQALDRFFVDMPPPATPDPRLLGDFFVPADVSLGALAEIYGLTIEPAEAATSLADYFAAHLGHAAHAGDRLPLGAVALIAHAVADGRVTTVGLQLAEPDPMPPPRRRRLRRFRAALRRARAQLRRKR
ncbi:MAG TPA: potassium/proton antiporter [Xanthobacteraceae bacterium]|jgi:cell volume regulation protein A|nr:potassium/proton antiporter [Xanthobacteraceae bacterium]